MTNVPLLFAKSVGALPLTLNANSFYAVRIGEGFDLYLSDSTGAVAHKINADIAPTTHAYNSIYYYGFNNNSELDEWESHSGLGERVITDGVLKVGNNSGNDQSWISNKELIPVLSGCVYRLTVRVRRLAGAGRFYLGVMGVKSDGITLTNIRGANTYSGQYYCHATTTMPSEWIEYSGYVITQTANVKDGLILENKKTLRADVAFIRPVLISNYANKSGIVEVDWLKVELVPSYLLV